MFVSAAFALFNIHMRHLTEKQGSDWFGQTMDAVEVLPVVGSAYLALCLMMNRTDVMISGDRVRTMSRPLPWWGDRDVPASEIRKLVTEERSSEEGKIFCLEYVDGRGKKRVLVRGSKEKEQMEFIEKAIRYLQGKEEEPPAVRDESTEPSAQLEDYPSLYRSAFDAFASTALWNARKLENPTAEDALVIAGRLRMEGNLATRRLAEHIENACHAAHWVSVAHSG
jgi:hypothetical protein